MSDSSSESNSSSECTFDEDLDKISLDDVSKQGNERRLKSKRLLVPIKKPSRLIDLTALIATPEVEIEGRVRANTHVLDIETEVFTPEKFVSRRRLTEDADQLVTRREGHVDVRYSSSSGSQSNEDSKPSDGQGPQAPEDLD